MKTQVNKKRYAILAAGVLVLLSVLVLLRLKSCLWQKNEVEAPKSEMKKRVLSTPGFELAPKENQKMPGYGGREPLGKAPPEKEKTTGLDLEATKIQVAPDKSRVEPKSTREIKPKDKPSLVKKIVENKVVPPNSSGAETSSPKKEPEEQIRICWGFRGSEAYDRFEVQCPGFEGRSECLAPCFFAGSEAMDRCEVEYQIVFGRCLRPPEDNPACLPPDGSEALYRWVVRCQSAGGVKCPIPCFLQNRNEVRFIIKDDPKKAH